MSHIYFEQRDLFQDEFFKYSWSALSQNRIFMKIKNFYAHATLSKEIYFKNNMFIRNADQR